MLLILSPLVAAIVGLLMYALATNPKLSEVGRILFAVGVLWLVSSVPSALGAGAPVHVVR